eukprot:CAMPEP_0175154608 /NCGR_PEP_ID=MMETSP0087-20121206/20453_1 /TAXON_ID=136419 /ORGANISM="Unknown Unknown, Strain D1" /LENGTH=323 /DNA_ID=CAMNT_0016441549 /DNA_START=74 /DNA_END=1043 /DNA_ORIENTATION=-
MTAQLATKPPATVQPVPMVPAPQTTAQTQSTGAAARAQAASAAAKINAMLSASNSAFPVQAQAAKPSLANPESLTANGLRKAGYTGGPVLSEQEAAGLKFGLHRENFQDRAQKIVKLLIGMEVGLANSICFPLLDKLKGSMNSHLLHIMQQSKGVLINLDGRDSGGPNPNEGLHFRLQSKDQNALDIAKQLCDSLIVTTRREYEAQRRVFAIQAAQSQPPPPAAAPVAKPPAAPAGDEYDPLAVSDSDSDANDAGATIPAVTNTAPAAANSTPAQKGGVEAEVAAGKGTLIEAEAEVEVEVGVPRITEVEVPRGPSESLAHFW